MTPILNDTPAEKDLLGYEKSIDILTDVIEKVEAPFTIGIFSKWGFGKTTIMTMIKRKIDNSGNIKSVWFNPWKYNEKELIWKALIAELYAVIVKDKRITIEFLKATLENTVNFIGDIVNKKEFGTKFFDIFRLEPQFLNQMENTTNKLINEYIGKQGRLVIFVDDLDRCLPENAIKVLEAIKLFFDNSKCIFVIGLDKSVVEKGIHIIYDEKIGMNGIDYLEKIIQLPFNIPGIKDENIDRLIKQSCDDSTRKACFNVLKYGSDNNPRRIKRFLSLFNILKRTSDIEELDEKLLAKIIMLQLRFPAFYEFIAKNPAKLNRLNNVIRMDSLKKQKFFDNDPDLEIFDKDRELNQFLLNTLKIACREDKLIDYLRLTHIISINNIAEE